MNRCPGCDNCLGTEAKVFRCSGDGILGDERKLTAEAFERDQRIWRHDRKQDARFEAGEIPWSLL